MTRASLLCLVPIAMLMAACSPPEEAPRETAMTPPAVTPDAGEAAETTGNTANAPPAGSPGSTGSDAGDPSPTLGGDGSEINLQQVTSADVADLGGEIGCAFTTDDTTSLMVAKADVGEEARASAVVNNNDYGEVLMSRDTGGFGALERNGGTFSGRGLTITITPGTRAPDDGTEVVTQSAEMLVQRADGAERTYEGEWVCGP